MSTEHSSESPEFSFGGDSHGERRHIIDALRQEVFLETESLKSRLSYSGGEEGAFEYAMLGAQIMQLETLSELVLSVADEAIYDETIQLDSFNFASLVEESLEESDSTFFYTHQDRIRSIIENGESIGTNRFLKILVPSAVTDPNLRTKYYAKVSREAYNPGSYCLEQGHNGEAEYFVLPTALPGIVIRMSFSDGSPLPLRELCFIDAPNDASTSLDPRHEAEDATVESTIQSCIYRLRAQCEAYAQSEDVHSAESIQADRIEQMAKIVFSPFGFYEGPLGLDRFRIDPNADRTNSEREFTDMNMTIGEETFLAHLAPSDVDPKFRDVYFLPWGVSRAKEVGEVIMENEKGCTIRLATAVPGVFVYYAYSQGAQYPLRVIDTDYQRRAVEYSQNTNEVPEETLASIKDTSAEVELKLEDIYWQQPHEADLSDIVKTCEWLTATTRRHQLTILSRQILSAAEDNDRGIEFDVDSSQFLEGAEMPAEGFFEAYSEQALAAISEGERLGTADFLEILALDTIKDLVERRTYFYPWPLAIAEKWAIKEGFIINARPDASKQYSRPTRIQNLEVSYFCPRGSTTPRRTIKVK